MGEDRGLQHNIHAMLAAKASLFAPAAAPANLSDAAKETTLTRKNSR